MTILTLSDPYKFILILSFLWNCFHHGIKRNKKGNLQVFISNLFLTILSLYRNCDKKSQNCERFFLFCGGNKPQNFFILWLPYLK